MKLQRYDWEDALIEAATEGLIADGALLLGLRLAKAITWVPTNGRPSGLYWANDDACESVGIARATFYRHRKSLIETGFLKVTKGNLMPVIPEKSQIETDESQVETPESQVETPESQVDNPYSVDTYSGDSYSVYSSTVTDASAPVETDTSLCKESVPSSLMDEPNPSLTYETLGRSLDTQWKAAKSQVETHVYRPGLGVRRPKPPETLEEQRAAFAAIVVKPRKKPEPDDEWWL